MVFSSNNILYLPLCANVHIVLAYVLLLLPVCWKKPAALLTGRCLLCEHKPAITLCFMKSITFSGHMEMAEILKLGSVIQVGVLSLASRGFGSLSRSIPQALRL